MKKVLNFNKKNKVIQQKKLTEITSKNASAFVFLYKNYKEFACVIYSCTWKISMS